MAGQVLRVHHVHADTLRRGIAAIQAELKVTPVFPAAVQAAAEEAAASPKLPDLDRTDLPFVTIDPPGSRDLDQAVHIERDGDGFRVFYAIADLAAFVEPGGAVDVEANRRGETLYGADSKVPLHPPVLSEDAASLLPGQDRPALLWTITVDATGEGTAAHVERALVRSRAQLDYEGVQAQLDAGTAAESLVLLREVGELRKQREESRGGIALPLPEPGIDIDGEHWSLSFRQMLPVEEWNAQISLLTGMGAAELMTGARVGVLRTLPPPEPKDVARLHRTAKALGIAWAEDQLYPDFIRSLDPGRASHAAMVLACTQLLRGSGYVAFHGEVPERAEHSALAASYAHVTAPIRRLVDRYALEVCASICAGTEVPAWVLERLDDLPRTMQGSGQRAGQYAHAIVNLVEASVLQHHVGEQFDGVIVAVENGGGCKGAVVVQSPAIEAAVTSSGQLPLGTDVVVRLAEADPDTRTVHFELVSRPAEA